jgi:hypothetical protein
VPLEQIGQQCPFGIGQVGVHAAGAVVASVARGVAEANWLTALDCGALGGLAHGPHARDARSLEGFANRGRAHAQTAAPIELPSKFVQRRARQLVRDRDQNGVMIRPQQRLAAGTSLDRCFRMPQSAPRKLTDSASINA